MVERAGIGRAGAGRYADRYGAGGGLGLAHDFRNMLQLASSSVGLARRHVTGTGDSDLDALLQAALEALDRANLLARRLTVPGVQSGEIEPVLLQTLVPELRTLLSPALGGGICLESLVTDDLQPILCDRLELQNALLNLAINARQAMPRGGTLMIEAAHCARRDHHDCITLGVTDTGRGMTKEVADRAFEPFFSTRLLEGGSGLGLYNVRRFVEGIGGSIQLYTKANSGTRVVLHLPSMGEPWQQA